MTSDDLAREIHYAGIDSGQGPGWPWRAMTKPDSTDVKAPPERSPSPYEAPHVESVVTPEALAYRRYRMAMARSLPMAQEAD
jgi:hypothetical protein